jgi:hypothetical protein
MLSGRRAGGRGEARTGSDGASPSRKSGTGRSGGRAAMLCTKHRCVVRAKHAKHAKHGTRWGKSTPTSMRVCCRRSVARTPRTCHRRPWLPRSTGASQVADMADMVTMAGPSGGRRLPVGLRGPDRSAVGGGSVRRPDRAGSADGAASYKGPGPVRIRCALPAGSAVPSHDREPSGHSAVSRDPRSCGSVRRDRPA